MSFSRVTALADALKLDRPIRIVDVGANPLNDPPYQHLVKAGQTELVGFEPHKEAFDSLMDNAPDGAKFVNAAVGKDGRDVARLQVIIDEFAFPAR